MTESDLIAFADGRLGEREREAVARYLADHPEEAQKVETWRQQNAALQALYGSVSAEPVPARLDVHSIDNRLRSARLSGKSAAWFARKDQIHPIDPHRTDWRKFAAAAVVILAVGLTGGWFGRGLLISSARPSDPLVAEATQAHMLYASEVIHPVEVRAEDAPQLKTWLSKRLDRPLAIPDLKAYGFMLVGGRLLPSADGAAAQLMYEDETGQRVTLYIVPSRNEPETAIRRTSSRTGADGLQALFWNDETIRCALIGDLPQDRMQVLADETYKQLS
ncbi:transcriptional regulator [Agrobacterium vitis]|uniref:anti-sigma factor family protein n=1 Tax=Agrobacterium vitis TaxID=373 RepID=UPI0015DD2388|nr:anti-sigma factor [Agrobacterium vitis]BCH58433.1 transcriptional regulator [Agrobacterium vitis]